MSEIQIYVASLSDYNAGRHHGVWIDATLGEDHILEEIEKMLNESKEEVAEEWAIHDYEGFGDITLGEYEDLSDIAMLAENIEKHGEPYLALAENLSDYPTEDQFYDSYRGEYRNREEWAEEFLDDIGALSGLDEQLKCYFDYKSYADDCEMSGDIWFADGGMGVYVFHNI